MSSQPISKYCSQMRMAYSMTVRMLGWNVLDAQEMRGILSPPSVPELG
ncbi:hypothetical protein [Changpingibacter yushuensis]|nr:hypothetical protein [Changpingibacter yushuensis]